MSLFWCICYHAKCVSKHIFIYITIFTCVLIMLFFMICRLGPMVAMFKNSPIVTYTVSVPPVKLPFCNSIRQDWFAKEIENVIFLSDCACLFDF